jgi:hypothetical protein
MKKMSLLFTLVFSIVMGFGCTQMKPSNVNGTDENYEEKRGGEGAIIGNGKPLVVPGTDFVVYVPDESEIYFEAGVGYATIQNEFSLIAHVDRYLPHDTTIEELHDYLNIVYPGITPTEVTSDGYLGLEVVVPGALDMSWPDATIKYFPTQDGVVRVRTLWFETIGQAMVNWPIYFPSELDGISDAGLDL